MSSAHKSDEVGNEDWGTCVRRCPHIQIEVVAYPEFEPQEIRVPRKLTDQVALLFTLIR